MCHGSAPLLEQVISDEEVLTVIRIIVETGLLGVGDCCTVVGGMFSSAVPFYCSYTLLTTCSQEQWPSGLSKRRVGKNIDNILVHIFYHSSASGDGSNSTNSVDVATDTTGHVERRRPVFGHRYLFIAVAVACGGSG